MQISSGKMWKLIFQDFQASIWQGRTVNLEDGKPHDWGRFATIDLVLLGSEASYDCHGSLVPCLQCLIGLFDIVCWGKTHHNYVQ
jgi:hypothetical protein